MRTLIVAYLQSLKPRQLGDFAVSRELPWSNDGTVMYLKNFKRIYVGTEEVERDNDLMTLRGPLAIRETVTVSVYFTTDAKNLPANYDEIVELVDAFRTLESVAGYQERQSSVYREIDGDHMVTEVVFRFSQTILN